MVGLGSCAQGNRLDSAVGQTTAPSAYALATATLPFLPSDTPTPALQQAAHLTQVKARRLVIPADPVTVAIYTLDDRCEGFQAEPVQMPRQDDLSQTVGLILAEQAAPNLDLSGYRVDMQPETKTATIDLRVSRGSPRVLNSLSLCEQKALLGSLKETLVNHPDWDIETVTFTNRGHQLVL